jgi:hypothetical protein
MTGVTDPELITHHWKTTNQHCHEPMGCSVLASETGSLEMSRSKGRRILKLIVIGGTIGSKLVKKVGEHGHEAVAAAPSSGVNSLTGEGLADALKGASVVVDVTNAPSWEGESSAEVLRDINP